MRTMLRNRPCSCGSGRPAASCCGRFRRVTERDAALAYLDRRGRAAWEVVSPFSARAIAALSAEAAALPAECETFTAALLVAREPVQSDIRRVARLLAAGHNHDPSLDAALRRADTPVARAAMVKALNHLRESAEVDEYVAAAAVFELAGGRSRLATAALLHAAAATSTTTAPGTGTVAHRPVTA